MPVPPGASDGAGRDGGKQGKEVALAIFWEGEDLFDGVNFAAKDNLLHTPGGVAFAELLDGDYFFLCSVVLGISPEEFVNGAEEVLRHLPSFGWHSLDYTDEFIEVYFDVR